MGDLDFSVAEQNSARIESKKKRRKLYIIIFISILFILCLIAQNIFNRYKMPEYDGVVIISGVQGVINVIEILLGVLLVTNSRQGYYVSIMLYIPAVVLVSIPLIVKQDASVVPGFAITVAGLCIVCIIHTYLQKLDKKERELFNLAHTDSLTELPNRRALKQHMLDIIEKDSGGKAKFAIAMIDLDNFKNVNDTIGHEWGDTVLSNISERWKKVATKNDFIARLGGDEFALIVDNYASLSVLDNHMKDFLEAVGEKFVLKNKDYYMSCSIGIALYPSDSNETGQLLKYADMAMYAAKYQGKNRMCYFDNMMNDAIENSVEMENIIRRAVDTDTFRLVYQPQYTTEDKKLRGFETLIRLSDDKGKQVSPAQFIPVAEKSSLIVDVDKWVLRHAMTSFKPHIDENSELLLSVNISAMHMLDEHFLDELDMIIEETGFPAKNLELELTESVFVNSLERAKAIMESIKARGIKIALDDFGTGYSSLSYLKELPIDLLKIDKAFVDSIISGPKEESFVAAIISLGQVMQFRVISEGVEDQKQLEVLRKLGCDYVQGFIWGKPLNLDDALELLK